MATRAQMQDIIDKLKERNVGLEEEIEDVRQQLLNKIEIKTRRVDYLEESIKQVELALEYRNKRVRELEVVIADLVLNGVIK